MWPTARSGFQFFVYQDEVSLRCSCLSHIPESKTLFLFLSKKTNIKRQIHFQSSKHDHLLISLLCYRYSYMVVIQKKSHLRRALRKELFMQIYGLLIPEPGNGTKYVLLQLVRL